MWPDLTSFTLLFTGCLQSACPPHASCKAPSVLSLQGLYTCSSSAWNGAPNYPCGETSPFLHVNFQGITLSERPSLILSHFPSPSLSPLPCFGCLHNICHHLTFYISLFVSLVLVHLPYLECRFHDIKGSDCSIHCATPSQHLPRTEVCPAESG